LGSANKTLPGEDGICQGNLRRLRGSMGGGGEPIKKNQNREEPKVGGKKKGEKKAGGGLGEKETPDVSERQARLPFREKYLKERDRKNRRNHVKQRKN